MNTNVNWALKTEALLIPTPLAGVDPAGEPARVDHLRKHLRLPDRPEHADFLAACARDAGFAQGPLALNVLPNLRDPDVRGLRHPMEPDLPRVDVSLSTLSAGWKDWVESLPREHNSGHARDGDTYRRLWYSFMSPRRGFVGVVNRWDLPDHAAVAHRSLTAALAGARSEGGGAALLLLSVGPVQEVIDASRRTHDLWGGSYLMSWLAYTMMATIIEKFGPDAVITPFPLGLALPEKKLFQNDGIGPTALLQPSLPAKVLVVVPERDADTLAREVLDAARDAWREMVGKVYDGFSSPGGEFGKTITADQLWAACEGLLEQRAAVVPWADLGAAQEMLRSFGWPEPGSINAQYDSLGKVYGALSTVAWTALSAAGRAELPAPLQSQPVPKCGVCGVRDQLGPAPNPAEPHSEIFHHRTFWRTVARELSDSESRESLQLADGEGLCGPCLVRRFAPEHYFGTDAAGLGLLWNNERDRAQLRYPSVSSIASALFRWVLARQGNRELVGVKVNEPELARKLDAWRGAVFRCHSALDFTPPGNQVPGLAEIGRSGRAELDVDGGWLDLDAYESAPAWRDHRGRPAPTQTQPPPGISSDQWAKDKVAYDKVSRSVLAAKSTFEALTRELDVSPCAYYAVLYMDGDKMSRWLNGTHPRTPLWGEVLTDPEDTRVPRDQKRPVFPALQAELSRRLCTLASGAVPDLVHQHLGRLVYCGGDDIVAFLPLATVFACAQRLYDLFRQPEHLGKRFTLSAGVALVHQRDPLGEAMQLARKAERAAKCFHHLPVKGEEAPNKGNALSVIVDVRSGTQREVTLPWYLGETGRNGASSVEALLKLADGRGDAAEGTEMAQSDTPPNLRLVHVLERELAALGSTRLERESKIKESPADRAWRTEALLNRLSYLGGETGTALPRWVLQHPTLDAEGRPTADGPERLVNVLHLARFLEREQRGLSFWQLYEVLHHQPLPGARARAGAKEGV